MNETATAVAPATEILDWEPCRYTGTTVLEGFGESPIDGVYAQSGEAFVFQPNGSTKIFEVSDLDLIRTPMLS